MIAFFSRPMNEIFGDLVVYGVIIWFIYASFIFVMTMLGRMKQGLAGEESDSQLKTVLDGFVMIFILFIIYLVYKGAEWLYLNQ